MKNKIAKVFFPVVFVAMIMLSLFGPITITMITTNNAEAKQVTSLSPTSQPACKCIPKDLAESLEKMAQVVELLNDELRTVKANEAYWFNKWAEAQAEIGRLQKNEVELLQKEISRVKEMKEIYMNTAMPSEECPCRGAYGHCSCD